MGIACVEADSFDVMSIDHDGTTIGIRKLLISQRRVPLISMASEAGPDLML